MQKLKLIIVLCFSNLIIAPGQPVFNKATLMYKAIQNPDMALPDVLQGEVLPGGIHSDIIVEAGAVLEITSPLEMLPDATITVERGGLLKIKSTITGTDGGMWRGIIVQGNGFLPQTTANQGMVILYSTGTIEHATVGIDAQSIGADGIPMGGTGGGIVRVLNGNFVNNIISVRMGQYFIARNASRFFRPHFTVDDSYRGGAAQPVFVDLTATIKQGFLFPTFRDLRTDCSAPRAIGVLLKNAGATFKSGIFENLQTGIWADELRLGTGSLNISNATFKNCYTGIETHVTSSFRITDNTFLLKKPDACASAIGAVIGVLIKGNTTGFTFSGNDFTSGLAQGDTLHLESLIGTRCKALGDGMGNVIKQNTYDNLNVGNDALGNNGSEEGLLYLCNANTNDNADDLSFDFWIAPGATVKQVQGEETPNGLVLPTGNTFSNNTYNFYNLNSEVMIDYHFEEGDTSQEPMAGGFGSIGVNTLPVDQTNNLCGDPAPLCENPPCNEEILLKWKNDFDVNKSKWKDKYSLLVGGTLNRQAVKSMKKVAHSHRLEMNKYASLVLQQYSLDTMGMETDSLLHWLAITETFPADLRLARHYFFTGDTDEFDHLWKQVPTKYQLSKSQSDDYAALDDIYKLLLDVVKKNPSLQGIEEDILSKLLSNWAYWCSEPGFLAQSILLRNGITVKPDCSNTTLGSANRSDDGAADEVDIIKQTFRVYPNPASGTITIELEKEMSSAAEVLFINAQGREMLKEIIPAQGKVFVFSVAVLPSGLYYIKVQDKDRNILQQSKLIINH